MMSVNDDMSSIVQEISQYISQESSQCYLIYEVGKIIDEFLMSTMWDILRFFTPSIIWNNLSYYFSDFVGLLEKNKFV